jgi:serine/threonine protein kinase
MVQTDFPERGRRPKSPSKWQAPRPGHPNVPTRAQEWDWEHRYDRDSSRPLPAVDDIDGAWRLIKSIANPDGGFNGGIDLVQNKVSSDLAIRKRLVANPRTIDDEYSRWRREMLVMRKLKHPNIPFYIDGYYAHGRGSIFMQACRLGSVYRFVDSGAKAHLSFEVQEFFLWYILHRVAEVVLYMQTGFASLADARRSKHSKVEGWVSLVHGDIRPDQIFLNNTESDPRPQVLLGDWGFAQFIKPWRTTAKHDGPGARSSSKAPEFPGEISGATDVFALGVSAQLYLFPDRKAVTGLRPGVLPLIGLSHELDAIICSCVSLHVDDRPRIREVLEKLEAGIRVQERAGLKLSLVKGPIFKSLYAFLGTAVTR